jgi:putative molybdopterin biosynthesis protein
MMGERQNHNAVAAAVVQRRAEWGVAIRTAAESYGLGILPLQAEHCDFAIPRNRYKRVPVQCFRLLLQDPKASASLEQPGSEFILQQAR